MNRDTNEPCDKQTRWYVHSNSGYALVLEDDAHEGKGPDGTLDLVDGPFSTEKEAQECAQYLLTAIQERLKDERERFVSTAPVRFDSSVLRLRASEAGIVWSGPTGTHEAICPTCLRGGLFGSRRRDVQLTVVTEVDSGITDMFICCSSQCRPDTIAPAVVNLISDGFFADWPEEHVREYLRIIRSPLLDRVAAGDPSGTRWLVVYRETDWFVKCVPEQMAEIHRCAGCEVDGPYLTRQEGLNRVHAVREAMVTLPKDVFIEFVKEGLSDASKSAALRSARHEESIVAFNREAIMKVAEPEVSWTTDYSLAHEAICPKCGSGGVFGSRRWDVEVRADLQSDTPRCLTGEILRLRIKCGSDCCVGTGDISGLYLICDVARMCEWPAEDVRAYLAAIGSPLSQSPGLEQALEKMAASSDA